jgi:DMSO/TMAO reductase YedYZ heme-binding membrane subunit
MGWGALTFLVLSQAMSPAARLRLISPALQAMGRRDLGITAAILATLHALFSWIVVYRGHLLEELANTPWLEAGLAAWVLLLLLWVTSYPRLVSGLRLRAWKSLHHLSYVALALTWVHLFDSPWAQRWVVEILGLLILSLWLLRLVALPRRQG